MVTTIHMLSEYFRQPKPKKEEEQEEEPLWKDRPLHGMYYRQI